MVGPPHPIPPRGSGHPDCLGIGCSREAQGWLPGGSQLGFESCRELLQVRKTRNGNLGVGNSLGKGQGYLGNRL